MFSDEDDNEQIEDHYAEQEINFDIPDNDNTYKDIDMSNNQPIDFSIGFMWIILWVLKFQERFRMSDVSTNALIKFLWYLLLLQDAVTYASFPTSLAKAREVLGVCAHMVKYATCEKCCKLYNVADVSTEKPNMVPKISHCTFQDFPNHPMANQRRPCNSPITKKILISKG